MSDDDLSQRFTPVATPETQTFWDKAREGELWLPRCDDCALVVWYPRAFCPNCHSSSITWFRASGRATLASYVINHVAAPGFTAPYVIAFVDLEEGPRLTANLLDVEPDPALLSIGMSLEVTFEDRGTVVVLQFRPVSPSPAGASV
jgi:uncharacterized OB-fold protein